jgi:dephospho-CoA kinase
MVREELRSKHGMDAYARLSLPAIRRSLSQGPTAIDGLYSWSEYKFLKTRFGERMKVVAIFTPRAMRYARLSKRPERPLTFEEAEQRDFAEIENVEKGGPIAIADYTLSMMELRRTFSTLWTDCCPLWTHDSPYLLSSVSRLLSPSIYVMSSTTPPALQQW